MLARHWYRKEVKKYIIYGLGFGYHIYEMLYLSEHSEIIIYEGDLNVILLACTFARLHDIFETGRVKLVYDPSFHELDRSLKNLPKDEAFFVHYPSYQNIRSDKGRELLKDYVSWS